MTKLYSAKAALGGLLFLLLTVAPADVWAQLSITVTGEDISCFGLPTGSATATPLNGTAPFSYQWSNGGTAATITNLTAGAYSVTVTDNTGAVATGSVTLTEPDRVIATIDDPTECEGPFTIAADPQGGVAPYTYNWSTGADTRAIIVPEGDYCVTVVDANLCGYVVCTEVDDNPPGVNLVSVDVRCNGDDDGVITANPFGGVAPYNYTWSNGQEGQTISNLSPGAYGVTITDARGCTASASTSISEPPVLTGSIFGDDSVCPGASDGFIRIAPQGGTPPYAYLWSTGSTSQGIGTLPAGTYSVTVTDNNNCTLVDTYVLTTAPAVEIEITGDLLLCGAGSTGTLTASPVTGPVNQYTYVWSTGAQTPTITNAGAGTYSVTATDANGCTGTATATVTTIDLDVTLSSTNVTCFGDTDGTATAVASGGTMPYEYAWSTGATTQTITGLGAGVYSVTVTEANGCKAIGNVQVGSPAPLNISATPTNVTCPGGSDGAIDVTVTGGTPAYTYTWSDGVVGEDRTNLAAGTYTVTVTDSRGCTDNLTITISAPTPLAVNPTVTDVACNGDNTGRISLVIAGGTPGYTVTWNDGATGAVRNNLPAGSYTATITDANGCSIAQTFTISEPPAIIVTGSVTNVDCAGGNNGAIDLTVSGGSAPYSVNWSNGAITEDLTNLTAGVYMVTVTDANECSETAAFQITQPSPIALSSVPTNVACEGDATGSIDLTVSGGTPAYRYAWSNGATTQDISGLTAGTYSVTVTDANDCVAVIAVPITEPLALNAFAEITPVACTGDATGAIDLTAERGTPGYTYQWSNGATTQDISGLTAGSYTVVVTDAAGCTLTQTYMVSTVAELDVTGDITNVDCFGASTGAVDLSVSGGSGPYAYAWSNNTFNQDITNVPAGTYTVTVTDANECSVILSFTVTQPDEIQLTTTADDIVCGGTATGTIQAIAAGGAGGFTYLWSNGATTATISNVPAGIYSVTVTDANGCTDVTTGISLDELPQLTCEVIVDQEPTTGNNGQLTADVTGGTQPFTYAWSTGQTTQTIGGLSGGTYSVTVTDFNGCTTECTATLQALAGIGDFVWIDNVDFNGQQDPGEPGLADYPVALKNAAGQIIARDTTDENGFYSFMGLQPGTYSVLFIVPPGGERTFFNVGDDATDNDADPAMGGMTQTYTLAPGEFNMTVDAGFVAGPDGAITDPCNCLNNNTTNLDGQFSEILDVFASPGQTWTIIARENMFLAQDLDGTAPPQAPQLVPLGTELEFVEIVENDPVFGPLAKYAYEFRLVDSFRYSVTVSNGVTELSFTNQCFYPEVSFVTNPPEELCRFEAAFALEGIGIYRGEPLPGDAVFTLNGQPVTVIDPMALPVGEYVIEATFNPNPTLDEDGLEFCMPRLERRFILIEECGAKIGDFVWNDTNGNGQQDPGEPGIEDVKVVVQSEDGMYMDMTTTDVTGMYMFTVPPGTYKLTFEQPEGLVPTIRNEGDDATDSDVRGDLMTDFYVIAVGDTNLTIDAGFYIPCIENITNPGTIAESQVLCGPGNVPDPFVEIVPASGGQGTIEYLWMSNTVNPNQDISFWQPLPNSNTPNYAPGPVFETTYFARCVRRDRCQFIESNILTVEVDDVAVANISGPASVCVGDEAVFQAVNPAPGATLSWNFTGNSSTESSDQPVVTTTWSTFGSFTVTLTVTVDGCTSTRDFVVAVVNNPSRCGGSLTANGTINNLQARDVTVEWEVPMDGFSYEFALERSVNGVHFEPIANLTTPAFVSSSGMGMYRQDDISPLAGRTFYRVRMIDAEYGDMLSNVLEMQLSGQASSLGRIFPNPAANGIIHVEMTEEATTEGEVSVQLFDVRGNAVAPRSFANPGSGVINLPTEQRAAGVYFLRLTVGDRTETHRVILR